MLYRSVEAAIGRGEPSVVLGTTLAAWSQAHGFAVLWVNGNLPAELTDDPFRLASVVATGMMTLGEIAGRQAGTALPTLRT